MSSYGFDDNATNKPAFGPSDLSAQIHALHDQIRRMDFDRATEVNKLQIKIRALVSENQGLRNHVDKIEHECIILRNELDGDEPKADLLDTTYPDLEQEPQMSQCNAEIDLLSNEAASSEVDPVLHRQAPPDSSRIPYVVPTNPYKMESYLTPGTFTRYGLDSFLSNSVGKEYEPLWWNVLGIDPIIFQKKSSGKKWTDFFSKVFVPGDRFVVDVYKNNTRYSKEAFATEIRRRKITIPSTHPQVADVVMPVPSNILDLYKAISTADPSLADCVWSSSSYMSVHVYRGGVYQGNLHDVREGFELWQEEFELWAVKTGNYRLRRTPRHRWTEDVQFRGGLWMAKQPDGSFEVCPDQLAYR